MPLQYLQLCTVHYFNTCAQIGDKVITQNYGLPSPRKEWLPFAASDAVQYVFLAAADMPDLLYITLGVRECC